MDNTQIFKRNKRFFCT